jgi:ribosomal protein L11 methyltransferase
MVKLAKIFFFTTFARKDMSFTVLKITTPNVEYTEILQAELASLNFDVFLDTDSGFETSIETKDLDKQAVADLLDSYQDQATISYVWEEVAKQNWNEVWEKNFEPIVIADKCLVRADFHEPSGKYAHELIITPKMSFGTGHHATTALMIEHLLENDVTNKTVADCGCGTGILAIMAMKLGAKNAIGCDIEDWAVENTIENGLLNGVTIEAIQGTAQDILQLNLPPFEVLIVNIQLNVLLEEMPIYAKLCAKNALLLLSGIHTDYVKQLAQKADDYGFTLKNVKDNNNWAALGLLKR